MEIRDHQHIHPQIDQRLKPLLKGIVKIDKCKYIPVNRCRYLEGFRLIILTCNLSCKSLLALYIAWPETNLSTGL